jgi:hypothetical protein
MAFTELDNSPSREVNEVKWIWDGCDNATIDVSKKQIPDMEYFIRMRSGGPWGTI